MVLYVTLIAESHTKLLSHLKALSFYDADAISDRMLFVSGYHELMRDGLSGFLALIAATIKTSRPRFMVIDGFRSAREFSSTELELSQFIHELSAFVSAARCTTLILAPLSGNEPHPEHTLVDGLIELNRYSTGMRRAREIEVHKLRARDHLLGKHFFKITENGLVTFPRIEASPARRSRDAGLQEQARLRHFPISTRCSAAASCKARRPRSIGPSGVGKTLHVAQVPAGGRGARRALRLFRLLRVARAAARESASRSRSISMPAVQDGRLAIHWHPAVELAIDELAVELMNAVRKRTNASRLVVDGIDGFFQSANRAERFGLFLNALTHRLRDAGVTTMLTEELPLYGDAGLPTTLRASAMTENIVLMRYVEANSALYRMVSIVKQREGAHDSAIRRLIDRRARPAYQRRLHRPDGHAVRTPSLAPALSVSDPGARDMKKILVVDDEFDILTTWRLVLEMEGYEVSTASNGRTALDAARAQSARARHHRLDDAAHGRRRADPATRRERRARRRAGDSHERGGAMRRRSNIRTRSFAASRFPSTIWSTASNALSVRPERT